VRPSVLAVLLVGLVACDTMIASRVIVKTPVDEADSRASEQEALAAVAATLASCGLKGPADAATEGVWVWHDEAHPPDVHATVSASWNQVTVHLAQGLYGPIGPTEKYRAIKAALLADMKRRYGKASVQVE
jgi:hypothetical protein